jgi:hypothetical protein
MSAPKDGGSVFPAKGNFHGAPWESTGMSLRDWFAGMALQGFLVAEPTMQDAKAAEWSYALADAMLAAREGKEESK